MPSLSDSQASGANSKKISLSARAGEAIAIRARLKKAKNIFLEKVVIAFSIP